MNIEKCTTYVSEGDFDYSYYSIKEIEPSECEF